jgi:hypothetical protein
MADSLDDAKSSYAEFVDAWSDQRTQIEEDLRFSDPSAPDQWDTHQRIARENDPGGKRPCLVMDQTGQYVANVAGQVEQRPPSIHAIPVSGGADKKTAEYVDGRFRHIEHASRARQHYTRTLTSAARTGVGYLVVRPEYVNRKMGFQEPRISSEPDALKVLFDPWSTETDGSDATEAFIITSMSEARAKTRWGKTGIVSFGELDKTLSSSDQRKDIIVAEHWKKQQVKRKMLVYEQAPGDEATATEEEYKKACDEAGVLFPVLREFR